MDRYEDTYDPNNPPNSLLMPRVHSRALPWFIAALVTVVAIVAVVFVFWDAANPTAEDVQQRDRAVGTSGYYATDGGHDPVRRPGSTSDELKFRGTLTPPSEARGR